MRNIQSYADIETAREDGDLTAAEETLVACCREGRDCVLNGGTLPTAPNPAHNIGADLLRYLVTGGCDECKVHDLGVSLVGAYVPDTLVLNYAHAKGLTRLDNCRFRQTIYAQYCHFNTLSLRGSALQQGLDARGAVTIGSILLSEKFSAEGCINLAEAKIGGQLTCQGAQIEVAKDYALFAQGAQITDSVFLSHDFIAKGDISLSGSRIGGQLNCIEGHFYAKNTRALNLQNVESGQFFWKSVKDISGNVDLSGAHVSVLIDDHDSWEKVKTFSLLGFTYDLISVPGDTSKRLEWLSKSDIGDDEFSPQPFMQLAKFLREIGHDHGARQVLHEKERRLAAAEKQRSQDRISASKADEARQEFHKQSQKGKQISQVELTKLREEQLFSTLWSEILRRLVGYGYKPRLIFYWSGGIILAMAMLSSLTYNLGGMVPNSPVVLLSDEWGEAIEDFNPAEAWLATKAGRHYESFSAVAYTADVFIPLVPLGQEAAWAPTTQTTLGTIVWMLNWFVKLSGWFITALGAAAIAGVIRRD